MSEARSVKGGGGAAVASTASAKESAKESATADALVLLRRVQKGLKPAPPGALELVLRGAAESELVRDGAEVGTERLVADGARVYAEAAKFYAGASAARKRLVRGASEGLLSVAVAHLVGLEEKRAELEARTEKGGRERAAARVKARLTLTEGIVVRDQAWRAMANLAGDDKGLRAKVDEALGTAATPEALARGLRGLAAVAEEALGDEGMRQRGELFGVDDELVREVRATADAVQETSGAPERKSERGVEAQSALDREDGAQLRMFRAIVSAFEAAHDRDASVPRLVPIALRRLFARRGKSSVSDEGAGGGEVGKGGVSGEVGKGGVSGEVGKGGAGKEGGAAGEKK